MTKYTCQCGSEILISSKTSHNKSLKHQKFVNKIKKVEEKEVVEEKKEVEMISASSTRNFILKDPILDVFHIRGNPMNKYTDPRIIALREDNPNTLQCFIMEQGNKFESHVVKCLKEKFKDDFLDLGGNKDNCRDPLMCEKTVKAIKEGIPILYQAVLHHNKSKTFGIPDLIVRTDFLSRIFKNCPNCPNKNVGQNDYVIIDIKFTTLKLNSSGEFLLNQGSIPAYKAQLYIYNEALSEIQGYNSKQSYLLGRAVEYKDYKGNSCFDTAGCVSFDPEIGERHVDFGVPEKTQKAVEWVRKVKSECNTWDIFDPKLYEKYQELRPNMKNHSDSPWHKLKTIIANEIYEPTLMWNVGIKNRDLLFKNGISQWNNPECNASMMGRNTRIIGPILDAIIQINRDKEINKKEINIDETFRHKKGFYVDIETIGRVFDDFSTMPIIGGYPDYIIMFGVGYINHDGQLVHKSFASNHYTEEEEKRICTEFANYIQETLGVDVPLYHWGHIERSSWERMKRKYTLPDLCWYDLCKEMKDKKLSVKGLKSFGIKEVARTFYDKGYIPTSYIDCNVGDGSEAMIICFKAEKESLKQNKSVMETIEMQSITEYNRIDCIVLYEIANYLSKLTI